MNKLMTLLCCLMLAASPLALAQDKPKGDEKKAAPATEKAEKKAEKAKKEPTEAQKKQQERMTTCNAQAGDKKLEGDARKKFMSSCLKGETPGAADKKTAQQEKMTACNKEAGAKNLKGDERKKFMSNCLKG